MIGARQALALADLLLLASRAVSSPSERHRRELDAGEADVLELVRAAGAGDPGGTAAAIQACLAEARSTPLADWRGEHTRLFDGAVACPANETAYVRRDKGVIIADICGFYRAFGFEPSETSGEKPDQLACELEFAAMLLVMLARARQADDHEKAGITADALRSFLGEHLAEWMTPFCDRLAAATALPYYRRAASLIRSIWAAITETLDVPETPVLEPMMTEPDELDGVTPYECGMAEAEQLVPLTGPPDSGLPQRDPGPPRGTAWNRP
jgi:TorA maturation chaperone TorD